MDEEYGMTDLRPMFTNAQPQPNGLHYGMAILGAGGGSGMMFPSDSNTGGNCRWPRQETLTLLEVRASLDSKFKEANHKGPLWDEVSRIMCEEHGYQRSGKKCREKFENLYKYYKKTKEGKARRQDGKHYRFFRQLEALYGETSATPTSFSDTCGLQHSNKRLCDSPPSLSNNNSSCSSGYSTNPTDKRRCDWKTKMKEFVDVQMRKVMEKQEEWMEKMMRCIEQKEQERVLREEEWRKEEAARFEKEHKFWANERAWMESRDSALMEALHKLNGKESYNHSNGPWGENDLSRLIQLRSGMETRAASCFKNDLFGVNMQDQVGWHK